MAVTKTLARNDKDGLKSWIICGFCFSCMFVIGGITGPAFGIMVPYLHEYFGAEPSAILTIGSLQTGTMLLLAPLGSRMISVFGLHTTCIVGCLIATFSIFTSTLSPNIWTMIFLFGVCSGAGLSLLILFAIVYCDLSFEKERALASTIVRFGQILGFIIFPPVYDTVLRSYGWQVSLYMTASIIVLLLLVGLSLLLLEFMLMKSNYISTDKEIVAKDENTFLLSAEVGHVDQQNDKQNNICLKHISQHYDEQNNNFGGLKRNQSSHDTSVKHNKHYLLLSKFSVICILVGRFWGNGAIGVHNSVMASFLQERGSTSMESSILVSIENTAGLINCILCGTLASRTRFTASFISSIALILAGFNCLIATYCYNFNIFIVLFVLSGLTKTTFLCLNSVMWFDIVTTEMYTTAVPYSQVIQGLGAFLFPPLAGDLYMNLGSFTSSIYLEGLAFLVCGVLYAIGSYLAKESE